MSDDSLLSSDYAKLGLLAGGALYFGDFDLPAWSGLAISAAIVAGVVALFASGKIDDLIPDPRSVRIVQINANGEPLAAWKLSPDVFAETDIKWGPLFPHEGGEFETYEAYAYNPETNVAVGTWRRSIPGSEVVGKHDVEDVLALIGDYRGRLEPDARRLSAMRTALPAIVRELEFHRAEMQSSALDPSSPIRMDTPTIDDVITEQMPEELRPGHLQGGDLTTLLDDAAGPDDAGDWDEAFDLVLDDDDEALEPVGELANDGGTV